MTKKDQVSTAVVIKSLEKQAKPLYKKLDSFESIETQEEFNKAGDVAKSLKELAKLADKEEHYLSDPLTEAIKRIREHFKPFKNEVKQRDEAIKLVMLEFVEKQKKLSAKVDKDFEDGKIKNVGTYADKKAKAEIHNGAAKVRKVWKVIVDDVSKIPRQYMEPDLNAIEEVLKSGGSVAGCKYEQVEQIAI